MLSDTANTLKISAAKLRPIAGCRRDGVLSPTMRPKPKGAERLLARSLIRRPTLVAVLAPVLLAPASASALDCARATTANEKTICADASAREADNALGKAFEALHGATPANERAAVVAAQLRWIELRDSNCATTKDAALSVCLRDETKARVAFLTGTPAAGSGSPRALVPFFRQQKGSKGRADIDIQLLRFAAPANAGEKAFNAEVAKLVRVREPAKGDPQADSYSFQWSMSLPYASPRLVSAHADGYEYAGGAHPNRFTANFNLDVGRQRLLTFDDLAAAPSAKKIFALCAEQVTKQKRERIDNADDVGSPQSILESVAKATGDLGAWSFGGDKATISYDPYAVGAYAEGDYSCEIPYVTLRPLAKPDFPLP
jgi:uncharacterized protein YecT (DUF1311 family)